MHHERTLTLPNYMGGHLNADTYASPAVPRRQCRLVTRASAWPQAKNNGAPAKVDPRLAKRHGLPLFLVQLLLTVGLGAALFFAISKCVGHFGPCSLT